MAWAVKEHRPDPLRKRGEKLLHSKYLVSLVIILTIIDCSLVIAELILDLYSVKKTLLSTESQTFKFIKNIQARYPDQVKANDTVASFYDRIAHSIILWNNSNDMDFFGNGNFNTNPTSTVGMLHPFTPILQNEIQGQQPVWETNSQTVLVEDGNNPVSYAARRLRRSQERSSSFGQDGNHYQDNERRMKSTSNFEIRKLFRRVRRYVLTGLHNVSIQSIRNMATTPSSIEDYGVSVDYNYYNEFSNETNRQLDDLVFLHKMIAEIITMQTNGSQTKNVEYSNTNTAAELTKFDHDYDNNDVNFPSAVFSLVQDNDASDVKVQEDSSYSSVMAADGSQYSYYVSDGGNNGPGEESRGSRSKRHSDEYEENMRRDLHHSAEMEIAHRLHYASVCVSSILVFEVTLKIICEGSHFLKRKIQVFDAVVIVTSIIVDLIFMKGLPEFAVDDSIFVLALLLPWRVIRVVNSLVMAVIDHEQVKLRLLYSRKKKLDKTVESLRNELDEIKGTLQEIRTFCIKEGIEPTRVDGLLGKFAPRRRKDSKFYTLVKLVMSTASINNNDNDSVSSSSIENDLRHCINKDSVLNLAASSRGTMTSLKQYLSVPYSNDDSHSLSDVDSLAGDHSGLSPSIYITSPVSDDGRGMIGFCGINMEDNDVVMTSQEPVEQPGRRDKVATISVTSNTTNINTANGVSFFVGSQTSLNFGQSQDDMSDLETYSSHKDSGRRASFSATPTDTASSTAFDTNKNLASHQFGQFLTVPNCSDNVTTGQTPTISTFHSNNNNMTDANDISDATHEKSLPQEPKEEIKRSASENLNVALGFSPYEGVYSHGLHGSPAPARRLPEVRTKRKIYSRSHSESEDTDIFERLKRDRTGRLRRNSGDPQAHSRGRVLEPQRARSHSPSPMSFLSVPGNNRLRNDVTCSASRSMNDVSTAGNAHLMNSGGGIILQRSCLSLNTDGQKRREKSPHRVSFKVS